MINESIIDRILGYVSGIILNFKCVLCFKCSTSEVTKRKNVCSKETALWKNKTLVLCNTIFIYFNDYHTDYLINSVCSEHRFVHFVSMLISLPLTPKLRPFFRHLNRLRKDFLNPQFMKQ
jgi:hypothetical protein